MRLGHAISMGVANLRRNRLRSVLSLIGIVIGVFSVTLIVSLGYGLQAYVSGQVSQFGDTTVAIIPIVPDTGARGPFAFSANANSLKEDDLEALASTAQFPYIEEVVGQRTGIEYVIAGSEEYRSVILGVSSGYQAVDAQAKVGEGRFYSADEDRIDAPVVVLGWSVANKLFGSPENALGEKVRIKDLSMQVIGVMAKRGSFAGFDLDTVVFVPLGVTMNRLSGVDYMNEIDVKVDGAANVDRAKEDLIRWFRRRHGITDPDKDDFFVNTAKEVLETLGTVTSAITALLGFLAAISLLVGGIGIMNIMLVSVTERIREVGLRKALGAEAKDIRTQFLIESAVLTTAGGLLGGLLGFLATFGAIFAARAYGLAVPFGVSVPAFVAAALISAAIGVVFGMYPANKAAALEPINALRAE